MKIEKEIKTFAENYNLEYEVRSEEDLACWDKDCSHSHKEIHFWKKGVPNFGWSFEVGCTTKFIIETLRDRLKNCPW